MTKIARIASEEILDSNGIPTLRTSVYLDDGSVGTASVAVGASKGSNEVVELRDGDPGRFNGMGVLNAVNYTQGLIFAALKDVDPTDQEKVDSTMRSLDGTSDKHRLGGNAILSVSLAVAKALAAHLKISLFKYIRQLSKAELKDLRMPSPIVNLLEGGKHVRSGLDFQEFLATPKGEKSVGAGYAKIFKLIENLRKLIEKKRIGRVLGMEGGFAVNLSKNEEGIDLIKGAMANLEFSDKDFAVGLDIAAMSIYEGDKYHVRDVQNPLDASGFINFLEKLSKKHHLFYLEDPLNENDWDGWKKLSRKLSPNTLVVGDDLTTTNQNRLTQALNNEAVSAVVVKPNQIGTLSETLTFALRAQEAGVKVVVSHRGGETEDTFIVDLAVGLDADMIKIGSPLKKERFVKYKRLLDIEKEIWSKNT
ncbi:phosphopyruvate hydratase [Patescibacteria group bacterium]|nr:phosphopyruvate hydratase [Patescibacteria group bacterium]